MKLEHKLDEITLLYQACFTKNEYFFEMKPKYEPNFSSSSKYKIYKGIRKSDGLPVAIKIIPKNEIIIWKNESLPFEIYSMLLVNKKNENYIQLIDYDIKIRNVYIVMQLPDNLYSLNYFIKYYDNEELYQHHIDYIFCKVLFAYKKLTLKNILILDIYCSIQFYTTEPFRIKNILITNFSSAIE